MLHTAFTLVMHKLPDSLQCASFKIPKLYDISHLKYKCKVQFTSVKRTLHCALQV